MRSVAAFGVLSLACAEKKLTRRSLLETLHLTRHSHSLGEAAVAFIRKECKNASNCCAVQQLMIGDTMSHSKMVTTRRKNQKTKKRLARVAKQEKKLRKQSAQPERSQTVKESPA